MEMGTEALTGFVTVVPGVVVTIEHPMKIRAVATNPARAVKLRQLPISFMRSFIDSPLFERWKGILYKAFLGNGGRRIGMTVIDTSCATAGQPAPSCDESKSETDYTEKRFSTFVTCSPGTMPDCAVRAQARETGINVQRATINRPPM